jgi:hypothetical protein
MKYLVYKDKNARLSNNQSLAMKKMMFVLKQKNHILRRQKFQQYQPDEDMQNPAQADSPSPKGLAQNP